MPMKVKGLENEKDQSGWRQLVIFIIIGVLLVTFWAREDGVGPLNTIRGAASVITTPIARLGAVMTMPFSAIGNGMTNISADSETLTSLKDRNAELTAQVAQLEEYKQENQRLTELLSLEDTYQVDGVAARVIDQGGSSYDRTVTIDKGESDGIVAGIPVMSAQGLIGQVDTANPTSSVVRLLSDQSSGVSATIQSSRATGVVTGSVDGQLYLEYIGTDVTVNVGDLVVTSGLGGTFPKGILVGQVLSVEDAPGALYHTIIVSAAASFENFEEVLVVTSTAADAASADTAAAGDATGAGTASGSGTTSSTDTASAGAGTVAGTDAATTDATAADQTGGAA